MIKNNPASLFLVGIALTVFASMQTWAQTANSDGYIIKDMKRGIVITIPSLNWTEVSLHERGIVVNTAHQEGSFPAASINLSDYESIDPITTAKDAYNIERRRVAGSNIKFLKESETLTIGNEQALSMTINTADVTYVDDNGNSSTVNHIKRQVFFMRGPAAYELEFSAEEKNIAINSDFAEILKGGIQTIPPIAGGGAELKDRLRGLVFNTPNSKWNVLANEKGFSITHMANDGSYMDDATVQIRTIHAEYNAPTIQAVLDKLRAGPKGPFAACSPAVQTVIGSESALQVTCKDDRSNNFPIILFSHKGKSYNLIYNEKEFARFKDDITVIIKGIQTI